MPNYGTGGSAQMFGAGGSSNPTGGSSALGVGGGGNVVVDRGGLQTLFQDLPSNIAWDTVQLTASY